LRSHRGRELRLRGPLGARAAEAGSVLRLGWGHGWSGAWQLPVALGTHEGLREGQLGTVENLSPSICSDLPGHL